MFLRAAGHENRIPSTPSTIEAHESGIENDHSGWLAVTLKPHSEHSELDPDQLLKNSLLYQIQMIMFSPLNKILRITVP